MSALDHQVINEPAVTYRKNYQAPTFFIDEVELHFDLFDDHAIVRSRLWIRRNRRHDEPASDLFLNGEQLECVSIHCDGKALDASRYTLSDKGVMIKQLADSHELLITTKIYPQKNTALSGLYRSRKTFCTQCEAEGFRRITYFLDHPDVLAKYTTTIEADKKNYPSLLSNGNLVEQGESANGRHWAKWEDPFKKPCYLFALVAGEFDCREDQFTTQSGRQVTLRLFVEKGLLDQSAHAMHSLKEAMRWDETAYGREYDLDIFMIVAISDFNMGAMENKGLNIFNTKYVLAKPETATDDDYLHILSVVGHEYFHNWSGNRVTCRDWFQLSLKEGLTIFRDQSFSEDLISPAVMRIRDVTDLRETQFIEDAGPLSHPVRPDSYIEIDNFYTSTIYNKGAEVLRMMKTLLGAAAFRKGMDAYFETFDGQAVTIDNFVETMESVSKVDLAQFRRWYSQSGTPVVSVKQDYDAKTQTYRLTLRQMTHPTADQAEKQALHIPVKMGLLSAAGEVLPLYIEGETVENEKVLSLTQPEQVFVFNKVTSRPIPSLLRGFSAPIKLSLDLSDEEKLVLMTHDTDAFNRFEAAQQLALSHAARLMCDYQQNKPLTFPEAWAETLSLLLTRTNEDAFFLATILCLPSEKYIGEYMAVVDVEAIHAVREFMLQSLSDALQSRLYEVYETQTLLANATAFNAKVIGARALKNAVLHLLSYQKEGLSLADQQLTNSLATNMTGSLSAMSALNRQDSGLREQAFSVFFTVWKNDALVMDKWFALQAVSPRVSTLADVKILTKHPLFDWKNPNKVYALIGGFCARNAVRFHEKSGEGYAFLREAVQKLDPMNPQVAARMVKPLTTWKRYDKERQAKMRQELEIILNSPGLSPDVYELVTKSLV